MSLIEEFDGFITEMMALGLDSEDIAFMLLHEDVALNEEADTLLETVKKRVVRRGGHTFVLARRGRPNPARSIKAKMAARKGMAKRKMAQRKTSTKMKRKQAMRMRRGIGAKPRVKKVRMKSPKFKRPKVRRSGAPRVRRPKRPSYRRR